MATSPVGSSSSSNNDKLASGTNSALNKIDTAEFLKLMIAELQNQDPLNPADNTQLLTQMSQIRQVASSDKLSTTLDTVLLGQNLTNATSLIGKKIDALGDDQKDLTGVVDKVTITDGDVKVHVGERTAKITNIKEILPAPTSTTPTTTTPATTS